MHTEIAEVYECWGLKYYNSKLNDYIPPPLIGMLLVFVDKWWFRRWWWWRSTHRISDRENGGKIRSGTKSTKETFSYHISGNVYEGLSFINPVIICLTIIYEHHWFNC